MKAGVTGTEYSATAYTASDVERRIKSAPPASVRGTTSPRGRRMSAASNPTRSQRTGRGYQRESAVEPVDPLGTDRTVGEAVEESVDPSIDLGRARRVGRPREDDLMLGRGRPDLADPAVRCRDVARLARGRNQLALARHRKLQVRDGHPRARAGLGVRHRRVERPHEQASHIARDPSRVGARVREHGLAADTRKVAVVVVPAPHAVGEAGQVLVHARAARRKELLEVDLVRAIRLERQEVACNGTLELARGRAVLGLHDVVGHERSEQRKRRSAPACQCEVVCPEGVVSRPGEQGDDRREDEGSCALQPHSPRLAREERDEREQEQHLCDRTDENQARYAGTERDRSGCASAARQHARAARRRGRTPRRTRRRSTAGGRAPRSRGTGAALPRLRSPPQLRSASQPRTRRGSRAHREARPRPRRRLAPLRAAHRRRAVFRAFGRPTRTGTRRDRRRAARR